MTYSFLDVVATLIGPGGVAMLGNGSGASEEGISVEYVEEADNMVIGADGSTVHSLHASKAVRVRVSLLKTSPMNAILSGMYNLQHTSSLLWGKNALTIANITTGDGYVIQGAAFAKFPQNRYSRDAAMLDWEFNGSTSATQLGVAS
jgi:hypothetical protein